MAKERGQTLRLTGQVRPTPNADSVGGDGGPNRTYGNGTPTLGGIGNLLPAPAAMNPNDGEGTATWLARRERVKATAKNGNGMGMPLAIAVQLLPGGDDAASADSDDE